MRFPEKKHLIKQFLLKSLHQNACTKYFWQKMKPYGTKLKTMIKKSVRDL